MLTASRRPIGFLSALPPYLGGKRKLLGHILRALPRPADAPVLVDAFLGGGAVSLFAKARGYRVVCNDIAFRSAIVGRAFIANDRVKLSKEDVLRLFAAGDHGDFIEHNFAPDVLPAHHARFLDAALPHALRLGDTKGALLQLLVLRYVLALRPLGNFGAKTVMRQMAERDWDAVNPLVLRDCFAERILAHPLTLCEEFREKINAGVFSNGHANECHQADVFDFLADVEGDVVYLDPPYAGTQAYETALRPLDSILEGRMVDMRTSSFSGRHALETLNRLLHACRRFPHLVLSYGNAVVSPPDLEAIVRKHRRNVRVDVIAHTHLTGLASDKSRQTNREILITAGGEK